MRRLKTAIFFFELKLQRIGFKGWTACLPFFFFIMVMDIEDLEKILNFLEFKKWVVE